MELIKKIKALFSRSTEKIRNLCGKSKLNFAERRIQRLERELALFRQLEEERKQIFGELEDCQKCMTLALRNRTIEGKAKFQQEAKRHEALLRQFCVMLGTGGDVYLARMAFSALEEYAKRAFSGLKVVRGGGLK